MSFEVWWDKERNAHSIEYSKLGKYALRNIALTAYDKGYEDATKDMLKGVKEQYVGY